MTLFNVEVKKTITVVICADNYEEIEMTDNEDLKPCPCCGSGAYFDMVENDGLIDGRAGGWFVECINPECRLTTQLMFATGDDPRPILREIWNKRHNALAQGRGD